MDDGGGVLRRAGPSFYVIAVPVVLGGERARCGPASPLWWCFSPVEGLPRRGHGLDVPVGAVMGAPQGHE